MPRLTTEDLCVIKVCFEQKGWRGARIVQEFPNKHWNCRTVDRTIKRLESYASVDYRKHGAARTVTTAANQDLVETMLLSQENQPGSHLSHRRAARRLNISRTSVRRMAKRAGIKSFSRITVSRISPAVRNRRAERCRFLYRCYKNDDVKYMCFQDEKDFTLEVPSNRQNNRVNSLGRKMDIEPQRLYHEQSRFSLKLMVSCCVSWNGKTEIFFVNPQQTKVTSEVFVEHLEQELLPACEVLFPHGDYILVLDGATSHSAKRTQDYLRTYAPRFVSAEKWPPTSPDLNPMDYYVWDALQEKVYEGRRDPFTSLDELQTMIKECWQLIPLAGIRRAISQWKRRIHCVIEARGGQIAHRYS
jgi:hypothetical protein